MSQIFDSTGALIPALPANAVLLPMLIGDSTSVGWEASNTDVRGTLPGGGTELESSSLWDKWDGANRFVHADDGTGWNVITNAMGINAGGSGAFIGPEFGLCYALEGRMAKRMPASVNPDVRLIKLGASGAGFHESYTSAAGCWSPRRAGTTLYALLRDYYLTPAITELLADGKRVFIDGLYVVGGGNDGLVAATYGYPPQNSLAASLQTLRLTLAADLGVEDLPMAFGKTVPFYNATYTNVDDVRLQQEILAATTNAKLVYLDHIERNTDGLHWTGQGALDVGLALGGALADYTWREITEAP
jgi:hypothetical protein